MNKKNNWYEISRVFIPVKIWLKRSLSQLQGGGMVRGHVRLVEQAVGGNGHKWRPVARQIYKVETASCQNEEEEP